MRSIHQLSRLAQEQHLDQWMHCTVWRNLIKLWLLVAVGPDLTREVSHISTGIGRQTFSQDAAGSIRVS